MAQRNRKNSIKKGNMAYRSYVIVVTICLFLLTSDIETMIIYVIIYLFSETDVFVFWNGL